jgi:hypothetical protein
MNPLERALRDFLAGRPQEVAVAVVGGIAVSARTEPRFTRDLDFVVAVATEAEADAYVFQLRQLGYQLEAAMERVSLSRLSTVRLRRGGRGPMVDLLFAATGIEQEIVAAAEPIEVIAGVTAQVARTGHLIAMKLVSRDDKHRPRDHEDLIQLARFADADEWARAERAVKLIEDRGFARGRDLGAAVAEWRARGAVTAG